MKRTIIFTSVLAVLASTAIQAPAQWADPPPSPSVALRPDAELDQLLAPIALYPDPLIAQILPAATQPGEIVLAARYVFGGGDMNLMDLQPWSQSVKAVARYSDVLRMMDQRLDWTAQLGQAFLFQQADVMNAIQRLRFQAQALGNLRTTAQQCVAVNSGVIEILPARPEIVYVPVYQPDCIFTRSGFFISFGGGFSISFWLDHDCDWHHHNIFAWHRDHFRPHDWWQRPPRERAMPVAVNNHITVVNRDVTVWRPQSRAPIMAANRTGHREETRNLHPAPATTVQPTVRSPEPRHETERTAQRPAPAPERQSRGSAVMGGSFTRDARPSSDSAQPRRETVIQPASPPRLAPPATAFRELRPNSGASQQRHEVTAPPAPRLPSTFPASSRDLRSSSGSTQPRREMTVQPPSRPPSSTPAPAVRKPGTSDPSVPDTSSRGVDSSDRRNRRPRSPN